MAGSYKQYQGYISSGVDWIGEVPSHWGVKRLKHIFDIKKRIAGRLGFDVLSITQRGIIVKDIESGDGQLSMDYSKYQLVFEGDFAMNHMDLLTGYVDISCFDGVTSPDYRVFRLKNYKRFNARYYLYLLQMCYRQKIFFPLGQGSAHLGRWRLPTEAFNDVVYPYPSFLEQQKIASFLDHETAKIDTLITKQEKLIELLQEKRQAVISHAVTKGLNPDVSMKNSGVKWLGEVPEHWFVVPNKRLFELTPKKSQIEQKKNELCSFIPMDKLKLGSLVLDEEREISSVFDGYTYFENEDILIAKVTPCFENKNMVVARNLKNGIGFGSSEIYVLRCNDKVNNDFMYLRLQEDGFMAIATAAMTGAGGLKRVPSEVISNFSIALPSLDEQINIVKALKDKLLSFDELSLKAIRAIELMKERKTALISAAVTGKIDVRDWQPKGIQE